MRIITATINPCIDRSFRVDRVVPERKLRCEDERRYPGGGGLNVARAIRHLGGQARALWSRGGAIGQLLDELLRDEGIDSRPIAIEGTTRENVIVDETASGEQYRFGLPGPPLSEDEQVRWKDAISNLEFNGEHAWLVVSGSLPPEVAPSWIGELIGAAPSSVGVIVDTKGEALRRAIEAGARIVKPNVHELSDLVDEELEGDEAVIGAARQLMAGGGTEAMLVSLGRGGALLVTADEAQGFRAPSVRVRSKVGAGDSMVAGLVYGLAEGWPVIEAARFGVATGAAAVMTPGTELCRGEDARRLFAAMTAAAAQ